MLLVYMRNFVGCTFSFMLSCDYWWLHCHQRRVFMTCCIGWVLHLRGSIHFFALLHAFLSSMLSGGVLVFRGSVLLSCVCLGEACKFCALFCCFVDYVFSFRLCWAIPIFLGIEPFPSRFGICDVSPASDFDIWFYVTFVHLDMSFTCLSITWMIFSTFASQTISCALMLSTHPSRGR